MKEAVIGKYIVLNNKSYTAEAIQSIEASGTLVYEVIRIINGVPLFFEDHMERLNSSAKSLNYSVKDIVEDIRSNIYTLIKLNSAQEANVKLIVFGFEQNEMQHAVYFIKSSYPSSEQYENGVAAITYQAERNNPNAKIINQTLRDQINKLLHDTGAYEALLLSNQQHITEGSRSNVFIVKDDCVYTAPASAVLIGITRIYILNICKSLGIPLYEQDISVSLLQEADGLFLTGTSPKVLPVSSVDDISYTSPSNNVIRAIMREYDLLINNYIFEIKTR